MRQSKKVETKKTAKAFKPYQCEKCGAAYLVRVPPPKCEKCGWHVLKRRTWLPWKQEDFREEEKGNEKLEEVKKKLNEKLGVGLMAFVILLPFTIWLGLITVIGLEAFWEMGQFSGEWWMFSLGWTMWCLLSLLIGTRIKMGWYMFLIVVLIFVFLIPVDLYTMWMHPREIPFPIITWLLGSPLILGAYGSMAEMRLVKRFALSMVVWIPLHAMIVGTGGRGPPWLILGVPITCCLAFYLAYVFWGKLKK